MKKTAQPIKLTKKQVEEEAKKKKDEDKKRREEELDRKRKEEAALKKIEEERLRLEEEERKAFEEIERLKKEEKILRPWRDEYENQISEQLSKMKEKEDWDKYSNCKEGYIDVSSEKELNGFIYEFKQRCDSNFIFNFRFVEKNLQDEINFFDFSQLVYQNLNRYLLEGRASLNINQIKYSYDYLNSIRELEKTKIESLTQYLIENFEFYRKLFIDEIMRKNRDGKDDYINVEWANKTNSMKLGFWINNSTDKSYKMALSEFKNINIQMMNFPKSQSNVMVRFFWTKTDIRELQLKEYCPYITISGVYFIDQILCPEKSQTVKNWEVRELIGNKYKEIEVKEGHMTQKIGYKIDIPSYVYIKDIVNHIKVGKYNEETSKWSFEGFESLKLQEETKRLSFYIDELSTFGIVVERKLSFPYKSWYLRCINPTTAILDLETPRIKLTFELGVRQLPNREYMGYVKLIKNTESEFSHIVNKEFKYDEIILELRHCGILINPFDEDITNARIKIHNYQSQDRAINDIIIACRQYAIRSHNLNSLIDENIILAKFKPNLEYDEYFFDDEEKDWTEVAWYPNKCLMGSTYTEDNSVRFKSSIDISRPHFHLLVKDYDAKIYDMISLFDQESSAFLAILRNFIQLVGIINMP